MSEEMISKTAVMDLLEVQKNTIMSFFSQSFSLINDRMDKIIKEVGELRHGQQFVSDVFDRKCSEINDHVDSLKEHVKNVKLLQGKHQEDIVGLKNKAVDLEDRSRRNNIRIDGITESENESWEDTGKKVEDVIRNKLKIKDPIEIERAHRVGGKRGRPRTILCKLLRYNDKEKIKANVKHLTGSNIYVNDDFSYETTHLRKELFEQAKTHRNNGHYAKVIYNRLIIHDGSKRQQQVDDHET